MNSLGEDERPLRVLMVHNHYLVRGGEDESFAAETELLRAGGHEVETYVRDNEEIATRGRLRTAVDTIWSGRSQREVSALLGKGNFDVMHVQNSFPLISPAIYGAGRAAGVAVVQTLRNYRPLCASGLLMREGEICEKCLGRGVGWAGVRHRCYRGSLPGSAVVVAMNAWHHMRATYLRDVDRFIVASELVRLKFVEGGFPEERICLKPNVVPLLPEGGAEKRERRAIYVGRLSADKGVELMVEAWVHHGLEIPLEIVGSGPLEAKLREKAHATPTISFSGRLPVEEACRAIGRSELLLLPTQWYETFGRTVLEAYAMGTAVLSSRGTAPGDLVREGETGFLVNRGDAGEIATGVRGFFELPSHERRRMGERALAEYRDHYSREKNLELLTGIYRDAAAEVLARSTRQS